MPGKSMRRRLRRSAAAEAGHGEPGASGCRYVAIIMDGNGRWAQRRHLPVAAGHRAGAKALRAVIERALDVGIEELTIFSFSTENWRRPLAEVAALMDLFVEMIEREVPELHERGARVRFLGRRAGVEPRLLARIAQSEALTAANTKMTLYIAFNYGGRTEIVDAARALLAAEAAREAEAAAEAARETEAAAAHGAALAAPVAAAGPAAAGEEGAAAAGSDLLRPYLYAPEMHDPELLIRTSGEMRISNFLLWQLAYTELYFSPKLWPDFSGDDLEAALAEFAQRRRRYGGR